MEIKVQKDCVQFIYESGEILNVYPGDSVTLPEGLTTEQRADVMEALAECEINNQALKEESDAENALLEEALAVAAAESEAKEDARTEATFIKRGKLPLPDDYRENPYLWEALARMGVVKSEAEEKAGD